MLILCTGINFNTAPIELRSQLSFSENEVETFANLMADRRFEDIPARISECVVVNTCNRLEVYFVADDRRAISRIQNELCAFKQVDPDLFRRHFYFFREDQAVRHLIRVSCGLDSMLLGEDQILGQVKDAFETAHQNGSSKTYLNVLFRTAVTAAKAIKTATALPTAPVSIASLAARTALNRFPQPTILLVGATGKTGLSVLKNLCSDGGCLVKATLRGRSLRRHATPEMLYQHPCLEWVDYEDRFKVLAEADVVISATSSPHYIFTARECQEALKDQHYRLFMDLAVPLDIDPSLGADPWVELIDIDSFRRLSEENNRRRKVQSQAADDRVYEYVDRFRKWRIFHESRGLVQDLDERIRLSSSMSSGDIVNNLIYNVREYATPEELEVFLKCLGPDIQQRYLVRTDARSRKDV